MKVGLFITCLVNLLRPQIAFASIKLLKQAGCEVIVPRDQTCCGQASFNSGMTEDAKKAALQLMQQFADCDYVVVPSGSCAGMIIKHYPEIFNEDIHPFVSRVYELTTFLNDVLKIKVDANYPHKITYHDSCSGLRELNVKTQPRELLQQVKGLSLCELKEPEVCCGFGGTFCVKYNEVSNKMVSDKIANVVASGADTLVAGDLGCLLNMEGKLSRMNLPVKVRHVAEILVGCDDEL